MSRLGSVLCFVTGQEFELETRFNYKHCEGFCELFRSKLWELWRCCNNLPDGKFKLSRILLHCHCCGHILMFDLWLQTKMRNGLPENIWFCEGLTFLSVPPRPIRGQDRHVDQSEGRRKRHEILTEINKISDVLSLLSSELPSVLSRCHITLSVHGATRKAVPAELSKKISRLKPKLQDPDKPWCIRPTLGSDHQKSIKIRPRWELRDWCLAWRRLRGLHQNHLQISSIT